MSLCVHGAFQKNGRRRVSVPHPKAAAIPQDKVTLTRNSGPRGRRLGRGWGKGQPRLISHKGPLFTRALLKLSASLLPRRGKRGWSQGGGWGAGA